MQISGLCQSAAPQHTRLPERYNQVWHVWPKICKTCAAGNYLQRNSISESDRFIDACSLRSRCTMQTPPQLFSAAKLSSSRTGLGSHFWTAAVTTPRRRDRPSIYARKTSPAQAPDQQSVDVGPTDSNSGDKQALFGQLSLLGTCVIVCHLSVCELTSSDVQLLLIPNCCS